MGRDLRWLACACLGLVACGDGETPALDAMDMPGCARTCDDGLFCNGVEICSPGAAQADADGCVAGVEPCPPDACNEGIRSCVTCEDADGDGRRAMSCGGDDCDDADPNRFPGNVEVCDAMDHDEDCDPMTFGVRDDDRDGFPDDRCCNVDDAGTRFCGSDCNDASSAVVAGGVEVCDLLDNNCDGSIDEDVQRTFYADADGDGVGDAAGGTVMACTPPPGFSELDGDCDDTSERIRPGIPERCDAPGEGGAIDENCNGEVNEACACVDGESRPCSLLGFCASGTEACDAATGMFETVCSIAPIVDGECDGVDRDCDGEVDEGLTIDCFPDADNDGFARGGAASAEVCPDDTGREAFGGCPLGTTNRMPTAAALDCDEGDPAISPAGTEVCSDRGPAADEDCDGAIDEGVSVVCYADADDDGFAPAGAVGMASCINALRPLVGGCPVGTTNRAPAGADVDCNDGSDRVSPLGVEVCLDPASPADEDCDGRTDEGVAVACYADGDNDGFALRGAARVQRCRDGARPAFGECDFGFTSRAPSGRANQDCDDTRRDASPGETEVCDGTVDNDCDGTVDQAPICVCTTGAVRNCPLLGVCASGIQTCLGSAWSPCSVTPTMSEVLCDGRDEDCDGTVDDGLLTTCYLDDDSDGYAALGAATLSACGCPSGYTARVPTAAENDCADDNRERFPGAREICNRIDDDCDGRSAVPEDNDNDRHAAVGLSSTVCIGGFPKDDCDDRDDDVFPGQFRRFSVRRPNGACPRGEIPCPCTGSGSPFVCRPELFPGAACPLFSVSCPSSTPAGAFDYNCDGLDDPEPVANCSAGCGTTGPRSSAAGRCGQSVPARTCLPSGSSGCLTLNSGTTVVECN